MILKSIKMENYTVFQDTSIDFTNGINVLIGENSTGKTHLLKLLYSACVAARKMRNWLSKGNWLSNSESI